MYFSQAGNLDDNALDQNIFESGWIDSFSTILLVEDLELEFGIQFAEEHFQDRRFATIRGIAEIVSELVDA